MPSRKKQLLDRALADLLRSGVAKLSLRPLAAHLGTSPRMLMFHFKSKEGLMKEIMNELHARMLVSFRKMASAHAANSRDALLMRFWQWATAKRNFPYLRLLYETQIIAAQNPAEYGRYLKHMSSDWREDTLHYLEKSIRTESIATLCVAVFDGLLLELMCTGDRRRLTRALDEFITMSRKGRKVKSLSNH